jgi:hypothetical protein
MMKRIMSLVSKSFIGIALAVPAGAQANLDWNASGTIHGTGAVTWIS